MPIPCPAPLPTQALLSFRSAPRDPGHHVCHHTRQRRHQQQQMDWNGHGANQENSSRVRLRGHHQRLWCAPFPSPRESLPAAGHICWGLRCRLVSGGGLARHDIRSVLMETTHRFAALWVMCYEVGSGLCSYYLPQLTAGRANNGESAYVKQYVHVFARHEDSRSKLHYCGQRLTGNGKLSLAVSGQVPSMQQALPRLTRTFGSQLMCFLSLFSSPLCHAQ